MLKKEKKYDEMCEQFKANSLLAMNSTKELLSQLSIQTNNKEIKELCINSIAESRKSDEGQEGVKAFFEKRRPEW